MEPLEGPRYIGHLATPCHPLDTFLAFFISLFGNASKQEYRNSKIRIDVKCLLPVTRVGVGRTFETVCLLVCLSVCLSAA